jgi:hypothetical protein
MVPHEDRPCEVVKPLPAVLARVATAFLLPMVLATLADLVRLAVRATHPMGPTFLSDFIVALGFVYEFVYTAHSGQVLGRQILNSITSSKPNMSHLLFQSATSYFLNVCP